MAVGTELTLSPEDQELKQDLEGVLMTRGEVVGQIKKDNLSLLEAALTYNKSEAVMDFIASSVITFLVTRNAATTVTLYMINAARLAKAARLGKAITEVKLVEMSTGATLASIAGSVALAGIYINTALFQKSVCIFSCVDDFARRVTDRQDGEFLRSPTFNKIENEIGKGKAMQFFTILRSIRAGNFASSDSLTAMKHFVENEVAKQKVSSMENLELPNAPTFAHVVQALNGVFDLNSIVTTYLIDSGQLT